MVGPPILDDNNTGCVLITEFKFYYVEGYFRCSRFFGDFTDWKFGV